MRERPNRPGGDGSTFVQTPQVSKDLLDGKAFRGIQAQHGFDRLVNITKLGGHVDFFAPAKAEGQKEGQVEGGTGKATERTTREGVGWHGSGESMKAKSGNRGAEVEADTYKYCIV